ncbi:MAG TPA: hypothetical protein VJ343_02905 [archaeon]|nr:hypothetical protein [archaeon]
MALDGGKPILIAGNPEKALKKWFGCIGYEGEFKLVIDPLVIRLKYNGVNASIPLNIVENGVDSSEYASARGGPVLNCHYKISLQNVQEFLVSKGWVKNEKTKS